MSVLPVGFGSALGGYQIERSLRFNSADNAYLNRTPGSAPSNADIGTWSFWVKRTKLATEEYIFGSRDGSNVTLTGIRFTSGDALEFTMFSGGSALARRITTQVFRDPSAWYHFVIVYNSTLATAGDRVKVYANGVEITAFSTTTNPSQNQDLIRWAANGIPNYIGNEGTTLGNYGDYYLTEVNYLDGQVPTTTTRTVNGVTENILSQLGEFSSSTGVWTPKAWDGTYGTNGFYLKFADNSNTTAATLGKDSSGNGNNWTPNLFSVTAGVNNDSLVDSPTSYGTDTGVGGEVRGNYCTLNSVSPLASGTLSNGNLAFTTGTSDAISVGTMAVSSGKWYWEITATTVNASLSAIGIIGQPPASLTVDLRTPSNGYCYISNGNKGNNNTTSAYGATYTSSDVIGVALDLDAGTLVFYKNGVSQGTAYSSLSGTFSPAIGDLSGANSGAVFNCNFGQRPFEKWNGSAYVANTAPSGFKALCTQNLPTPTIGATSTTQANDYMNVVTWSGNNVTPRTISGLDFQPDFVWLKDRTLAHNNYLYDAVRGAGNNSELSSNSAGQEGSLGASEYGYVSAFTSNGFTLTGGTDPTYYMADVNYPGSNFVAWQWKGNGAGSTNNNGTAKSSAVTVDSSTDTVTWNSHGMSDGQKIGFFAATMPGGLSAGTLYYVRDAATNTFKVAASSGGAAIDITSNGTSVTCHTTLTSTVSASATSGFSIVTYTGSGANATVEHGLGVAPSMVIVKCRSVSGNQWAVWQSALSGTEYLLLETTNAKATATTIWNSTIPSSTVFSVGTANATNQSTATFVAYCFAPVAGYSAFGSYTGNGSADGPFVYTGFRPRFVLLKSSSLAGSFWNIVDTARNSYNVINTQLYPNSSAAEGTVSVVDTLSNGFKIRTTNTDFNSNTNTYIYAAFAESPFKYALAR